jgi:hypothetical protein
MHFSTKYSLKTPEIKLNTKDIKIIEKKRPHKKK